MNQVVPLYHRESGQTGPAIVLLHGVFGSGDNLGVVARALAMDHRVIAVDLRNHGQSPWADSMDLAAMADDVLTLMDTLGLPTAHVLGHSLGGKVAMQLALQQPQRVSSLIVADIAPVTYPPSHQRILAGLERLAQVLPESRQAADAILAEFEPEPGVRQFLLKNLQRREDGRYGVRLNLAVIQREFMRLREAPTGPPYRGPCLFIKGERSDYILDAHHEAMRRLFPAHRLAIVAGTGHWLHAEKPAAFNALVRDFLAQS